MPKCSTIIPGNPAARIYRPSQNSASMAASDICLFPRRDALRTFQEDWKQAKANESHALSGGKERRSAPISPPQEGLISSVELEEPLASARQLSSLFVKNPARLEAKDQQLLAFLQQEKEIELAYRMTQQLFHLMKNKQGGTATAWVSICLWDLGTGSICSRLTKRAASFSSGLFSSLQQWDDGRICQ